VRLDRGDGDRICFAKIAARGGHQSRIVLAAAIRPRSGVGHSLSAIDSKYASLSNEYEEAGRSPDPDSPL
jgi:hypothetical protein